MEISSKNLALKENLGSGLNKQVQKKKEKKRKEGTLTVHNKQIEIYQWGLPVGCEGEKGS